VEKEKEEKEEKEKVEEKSTLILEVILLAMTPAGASEIFVVMIGTLLQHVRLRQRMKNW
jgi:hypothetical protein